MIGSQGWTWLSIWSCHGHPRSPRSAPEALSRLFYLQQCYLGVQTCLLNSFYTFFVLFFLTTDKALDMLISDVKCHLAPVGGPPHIISV